MDDEEQPVRDGIILKGVITDDVQNICITGKRNSQTFTKANPAVFARSQRDFLFFLKCGKKFRKHLIYIYYNSFQEVLFVAYAQTKPRQGDMQLKDFSTNIRIAVET